jgi:hypothetical protein
LTLYDIGMAMSALDDKVSKLQATVCTTLQTVIWHGRQMNPHSTLSRHKIRTPLGQAIPLVQTSPIPSRPIPHKPSCTPTREELAGEDRTAEERIIREDETLGPRSPEPLEETGTSGGAGTGVSGDSTFSRFFFLDSTAR